MSKHSGVQKTTVFGPELLLYFTGIDLIGAWTIAPEPRIKGTHLVRIDFVISPRLGKAT
jgi:hypothetical protein